MPYAFFNQLCVSDTNALTSNRKFLLPDDSIYQEVYTRMLKYPGGEEPSGLSNVRGDDYPSSKKAYQGKFAAPHESMKDRAIIQNKKCKSCSL